MIRHDCRNYETTNEQIEFLSVKKGEEVVVAIREIEIAFILEGTVTLSYLSIAGKIIDAGHMLLMVPGGRLNLTAQADASMLFLRFRDTIQLCDMYPLENLHQTEDQKSVDIGMLPFKPPITQFIRGFLPSYQDGIRCTYFFDAKIKEFLFLLRVYYDKEDLSEFFCPLTSVDLSFSNAIWGNYRCIHSVEELAQLLNYSNSGFREKFKRVFGQSAAQWLKEQRAKNIHHDLRTSNKSLKELTTEYHFSSVSHLNTFCKSNFGETPGKIRRTHIDK